LDKSGIKVAEYMTELPKRELLEQKLHKAVELARKRLEVKATECRHMLYRPAYQRRGQPRGISLG